MSGYALVADGVRADAARLGPAWSGSAADSCLAALRAVASLADELTAVAAAARRAPLSVSQLLLLGEEARLLRARFDSLAGGVSNERVLAGDVVRLEKALASGPLTVPQARQLLSARAVQTQLDRVRSSRPASLLAYDAAFAGDEGRAVLAVGDTATAEHVAVLVPGLEADVGGDLDDLVGNALDLSDAAAADAPEDTTAVVAWLGYDAPSVLMVASPFPAIAGGRLLDRDLRTLAASRSRDPHVTVIGHSYGSTTAAVAARGGAPLDDLVLLGSPGVLATSASQLRPPGHVFVAADSRDLVSRLGWFGPDPSSRSFGATRLRAESPPGTDAHSSYLDPGSDALAEVTHVVVGDLAGVRSTGPRGAGLERAVGDDMLLPGP